MTYLIPTRSWEVFGWTICATRAHPPQPWRPRLNLRSHTFRWLSVYIWWEASAGSEE
jgi:hypothetical protein